LWSKTEALSFITKESQFHNQEHRFENNHHVSTLDQIKVDITVVLGRTRMPIHMLLRMGRGAVIELDTTENDAVEIMANNHLIARGHVVVKGTRIQVEITEMIQKPEIIDKPGVSIGDGRIAAEAAVAMDF
jgi:flagellar motor switch protein FliN